MNDARVIKVIRSFSKNHGVDLYYVNGNEEDKTLFNNKVELFSRNTDNGLAVKLIRHSFFYREFDFFKDMVLKTGRNYDWIYCNDLPTLRPGILLKEKLGARLIYDSHEIYLETLNQFFPQNAGGFKSIAFNSMLWVMHFLGKRFEESNIDRADHMLTVNASLAAYFLRKYHLSKSPSIVYNCPDLDFVNGQKRNLKEELGISNDDVLLLYQGMLNEGRGLKRIIETMSILPGNFHLLIVGDGPLKKILKQFRKKRSLEKRVHFHPKVPFEELAAITQSADIGINLLEAINLSKSMALANKLFEYIHAGVPVLSSNTEEHRNIYAQFKIGELTENDSFSIKENILKMFVNKEDYQISLQRARDFYHWENQEKTLLSLIED